MLLRTFEVAARTQSFTVAAAELFLSPSAVSHAIKKLEVQVGVSLFKRNGRSIHLTPDGEAMMLYVGRGFEDLRRGIEAVAASSPGRLRLHCAPSFAAQWLAPRLPRFLNQYPTIEFHLSSGTQYLRFQGYELDADIVFDYHQENGLYAIPLGPETILPLCSPEIASTIRTPSDLLDQSLIDSYNRAVRWSKWFAGNGLAAPILRGPSFDRAFLSIRAAVDGLGVALESARLAEREIAEGKLVSPLAGRATDIQVINHTLVFPINSANRRPLRLFITWIESELRIDLGPY